MSTLVPLFIFNHNSNISVGSKITVEGNYDINNKKFNAQNIVYDD